MQKIRNFLNPLLKKTIGVSAYNQALIKYSWPHIIGQELADKCIPIRIEKGVLVILSESSTLNHHLLTIKGKIIDHVNSFLETKYIKDLFFINGNLKDFDWNSWKENKEETADLNKQLKKIKLDKKSLEDVTEFTKNVTNEQLRIEINKVLITNKKYQEVLLQQGYKKCANCELLVDKSVDKCIFCLQLDKKKLQKELKVILLEVPYIDFGECQKYLKCDRILFSDVKNSLIAELIKKIKMNKNTKKDLLIYAMLKLGEKAINMNDLELDILCQQVRSKP